MSKDSNTHPNSHELKWASDILELKLSGDASERDRRAAAAQSFFHQLRENSFFPDESRAVAIELVFGNSTSSQRVYIEASKREALERIDEVVQWFASQIGVVDLSAIRDELSVRLSAIASDASPIDVQNYVRDVQLAAEVLEFPRRQEVLDEKNRAARALVQAVFHISAIRSRKRRAVRQRLVKSIRNEFSDQELVAAQEIIGKNFGLPNERFHQPFLDLVFWTDEQTEEFELAEPVSAGTQSVVAYTKDFGRTVAPQKENSSSGSGWAWIFLLAAIGGVISFATRQFDANQNKSPAKGFRQMPSVPNDAFGGSDPSSDLLDVMDPLGPDFYTNPEESGVDFLKRIREAEEEHGKPENYYNLDSRPSLNPRVSPGLNPSSRTNWQIEND